MPSVTRSVSAAFDHTGRILFRPFDVGKWFVMGFCAFLAGLGGGFSFRFPSSPFGSEHETFNESLLWVHQHLVLVIILAVLALLLIAVIGTLFAWLAARGEFMFLDGIVHNRAQVSEPWHRFRTPANQLFLYRIAVAVAMLLFLMVMVLIGVVLAFPLIRQGSEAQLWKPLLFLALPTVLVMIGFGLFLMVLADFGVPLMYQAQVRPSEAMAIFRAEVLPGHAGAFVLFYLLKLGLAIGAGILILFAGCLTCCIGFLPYLSSVLTLPVAVFFRCYALDLLAQIDGKWDLFQAK